MVRSNVIENILKGNSACFGAWAPEQAADRGQARQVPWLLPFKERNFLSIEPIYRIGRRLSFSVFRGRRRVVVQSGQRCILARIYFWRSARLMLRLERLKYLSISKRIDKDR